MNRCNTSLSLKPRLGRYLVAAGIACTFIGTALPLAAQVQPGLGGTRTFPDAALRGTLTLNTISEATLNGRTIRVAPGMRLLSPQNTLVQRHTVIGQTYKVNYVLETSTGMLHAAWILSEAEAAKPLKGKSPAPTNITTDNVLK